MAPKATDRHTVPVCGKCKSGIGSIQTNRGLRCAACWMAGSRNLDIKNWKREVKE